MRKKFLRDSLRIAKVRIKKYDKRTGTFLIDVRYRTRAEVTDRTVKVGEAFGLGLDEFREHVIYDDLELRIGPSDVVYVTGVSGSGKSVLLRALEKDLESDGVINIEDVLVDGEKPLIDTVGETFQEGLTLLCKVGLNDAFLFVRRFGELSDGQKYRFKLAKLVESGRQFWVMDEFCSTLDRDTAKVVAFNVQKLARKMGRAVLAATSHEDLLEDFRPSVYVRKGFGKRIRVEYFPNEVNRVCTVTEKLCIEEGSKADYKALAEFHYRDARVPAPMKFFALKRGDEVVGVIVYSFSGILSYGRYKAFGRRVPVEELNRDFALISRVVLHPKFRSVGLGARLVRETLPLVGKPFVEAVAVMAKYNPFFERAGMTKVAESVPDQSIVSAVEALREFGFNPILLASERTNLRKLKEMSENELGKVKCVLSKVSSGYYKRLVGSSKAYLRKKEFMGVLEGASLEKLARVLRVLAILNQTKVYLLWRRPGRGGGDN